MSRVYDEAVAACKPLHVRLGRIGVDGALTVGLLENGQVMLYASGDHPQAREWIEFIGSSVAEMLAYLNSGQPKPTVGDIFKAGPVPAPANGVSK